MSPDREQVSDAGWKIAEVRSEILRGIVTADNGRERSHLVAHALGELSVSRATFYRLFARFRASEVTSAVLPEQSGRKNGSHFLDARREAIIAREIQVFTSSLSARVSASLSNRSMRYAIEKVCHW